MIHIHKYFLAKLGKKRDYHIYACALPNCPHRIEKALSSNRESICWKCGEKFMLYKAKYDRVKPICMKCANPTASNANLDLLMEELGIE